MPPCEWVIDILQEWVQNQGYLTTAYVDRGDPLTWDWELVDFIQDGTWRPLDLSAIVPTNAKAVNLSTVATNPAVHMHIKVSGYDHFLIAGYTVIRTTVANVSEVSRVPVGIIEPQTIYYNVQAAGWTWLKMRILGWWL